MSAVSVFFTHLNGNLLWNCLGNLDRDLGAVFLRDWVTLFFWNLDWNLDWNLMAGLVGDTVTVGDGHLMALLVGDLVTFLVVSVSVALLRVGGGALLLVSLAALLHVVCL